MNKTIVCMILALGTSSVPIATGQEARVAQISSAGIALPFRAELELHNLSDDEMRIARFPVFRLVAIQEPTTDQNVQVFADVHYAGSASPLWHFKYRCMRTELAIPPRNRFLVSQPCSGRWSDGPPRALFETSGTYRLEFACRTTSRRVFVDVAVPELADDDAELVSLMKRNVSVRSALLDPFWEPNKDCYNNLSSVKLDHLSDDYRLLVVYALARFHLSGYGEKMVLSKKQRSERTDTYLGTAEIFRGTEKEAEILNRLKEWEASIPTDSDIRRAEALLSSMNSPSFCFFRSRECSYLVFVGDSGT
jgi:hypothetical protein